nr:putative Ig domain-containing protein [uncultured Acetobacterium sp.]
MTIIKKIRVIFIIAAMLLTLILILILLPMSVAFADEKGPEDVYYSLNPGGTYYFDLSAQGIPGKINPNLPDTSLKWVPFTYAGTVRAYSLDGTSNGNAGASSSAVATPRTLFVADYNVSTYAAWIEYAQAGLIFGKQYDSRGLSYDIRSLSTGNSYVDGQGSPATNEWDQILNKNISYIKNSGTVSWGQDTSTYRTDYRSQRGGVSTRSYDRSFYSGSEDENGFRPALMVTKRINAGTYGLKAITYDMNGNGTLGSKSLTSATVIVNGYEDTVTLPAITEANGFNYTGPGKPGWYYEGTFYEPETQISLPTGAVLRVGCKVGSEQLNLPIGTYYFDLSTQNIPGTKNTAQPDSSLKWVPFTYAGTVNAYSRTSTGASTDLNVSVNKRSLFVADYNVTKVVSWDELNNAGLIFGKAFSKDGANYLLRSLSAGSNITGTGESLRGLPSTNEWDQILNKDRGYIKNTSEMYSWGQDTNLSNGWERYLRGYQSSPRGVWTYPTSVKIDTCGFRPVLEIQNPETLGIDGLKYITFNMGSLGTIGDKKTLTSAKVVYRDSLTLPAITEANGFNYSGPSGTGTLGWYVGSQFYKPGTTTTLAMGTVLTPGYSIAPSVTGPTAMSLSKGYSATSTGGYTITGTDSVTVSKTFGDDRITWNSSTKKLDIAAGLEVGNYPVTLTASNGISPDTTLNFTLTVVLTYKLEVTPNYKFFNTEKEGYGELPAQNFIIRNTGSGTITGLKASVPEGRGYEISESLTSDTIPPGGTATVKARPKSGLSKGPGLNIKYYDTTLNITGDNGISASVNLSFGVSGAAPTITGPTEMSLTEGYSATATGGYTITGTAPVTVSKTSGDAKITWDDTNKKLDIAAGLTAGSYPVVLTAQNSTLVNTSLKFTLTVKPSYTAEITPNSNIFNAVTEGYVEQEAKNFIILSTGTGTITALKATLINGSKFEISDPLTSDTILIGETAAVKVRPKTELSVGVHTDTLKITGDNGLIITVGLSFRVNTAPIAPVAPVITGPTEMSLTEGYSATATGGYTITGTAPVTVSKTSGDDKILWDDTNKKLDIAAGLTAGSYPVVLTAQNGTSPNATQNFTLTVKQDPDIAIVAAAKAAIVDGSVNMAFGANQADKTAAVQSYVNNLIAGDAEGVMATVTHDSGDQYNVALSKGSASDSKSITMMVNEAADPDIAIVMAAFNAVDGASYKNMTPAEAVGEDAVANAVTATAETAVNNSIVTVIVTKVWPGYVLPITGDADNPNGTNGRYGFKVTVSKGSQSLYTGWKYIDITAEPFIGITNAQAVAAAKAAIVDGSVDVSFGATQADKTAAVETYVKGMIDKIADAAGVTATVTHDSGNQYNVALSKGSASDSKSISMTVNEVADPDIATVATAFSAVDGASYKNMTPAEAISEEVVANAVKTTAETAVNNNSVTVIVTKVWPGYVLPTASDADNPNGTNGRYGFKVTVSKGSQSLYTGWKYIDITAEPFIGITNAQAVAAAKAAIVDGSVDVSFGATQTDKTAAVETYVKGMIDKIADAAGVTATVTYGSGNHYNVALSKGSASDSKSITIEIDPAPPTGTAPTITTNSLDNGVVGTAYSKSLTATGDSAFTWSIDSGDLPYGLTLDANTGCISGTPTTTGTFSFTVKAVNNEGDDTKALSIYISSASSGSDGGNTGGGSPTPDPEAPITHIITTSSAISFGSLTAGYTTPPIQTMTVKNTGNQSVTLTQPTSEHYAIGALSHNILNKDETVTFTIQPKPGLEAGSYNESFSIAGTNGASATISLSFTVMEAPVTVAYRGHIQDIGDYPLDGSWVNSPEKIGTVGQSKRIEGFEIRLGAAAPAEMELRYNVHVENKGWLYDENDCADWPKDGAYAGTRGESLRIEAVKLVLTDKDGKPYPGYSVYYRGHVQNIGDLPTKSANWCTDGEKLGTVGSSLRLEALLVKVVKNETDLTADPALLE